MYYYSIVKTDVSLLMYKADPEVQLPFVICVQVT